MKRQFARIQGNATIDQYVGESGFFSDESLEAPVVLAPKPPSRE